MTDTTKAKITKPFYVVTKDITTNEVLTSTKATRKELMKFLEECKGNEVVGIFRGKKLTLAEKTSYSLS